MPIQKHFTEAQLRARRKAVTRALARRAKAWGVVGWAAMGRPNRLSIRVRISSSRPAPVKRERVISLQPGFGRRVLVHLDHLTKWTGPSAIDFGNESLAVVQYPLAPGAPLLVGNSTGHHYGGIAAVVAIEGEPHLLTCGHVFSGGGSDVFVPSDPTDPVARLTKSYLRDDAPIDAAVCKLNPRGKRLLDASSKASTWFTGVRQPSSGAGPAGGVFWPTNRLDRMPFEVTITSFDASTTVLFDGDPGDGFIESSFAAIPGDSGSVLSIDEDYLGICSGQVDESQSYFTPIAAAIERLRGDYGEVHLWNPRDGGDGPAS